MQEANRERIDLWLSDLLGVPASMVFDGHLTVGMHSGLGDFLGIVVVGRGTSAHISLPHWANRELVDDLVERPISDLMSPKFWKHYPATDQLRVSPLVTHYFTDQAVEMPTKVERIVPADIADWRELVSRKKWEASGFAQQVEVAYGVRAQGDLAAASNLTLFRGVPSDVGVLTHPKYRGKGYASRVAKAATSYAVGNHEIARFRGNAEDPRSASIAEALGFEPYFDELRIVPKL
ncbi:MAG: GNAT family N-acetyltransferase [Nocardioidaceae bacterium]